jgi:molecular chaperone IbpA
MNNNKNWNYYPDPWDKWPKPHGKQDYNKPPAPKTVTIDTLFPNLDRFTIGWGSLLDDLQTVTKTRTSYPPYDIVELEDNKYVVNVAVAGFRREDIIITSEDSTLSITGSYGLKEEQNKDANEEKFIHNGIARRDFNLNFMLAEHVEIDSAKLEDGVLSIRLFKNIPEEKLPKVIDIQ